MSPSGDPDRQAEDGRLLLAFFTSEQSGPARRMESQLAHLARKERGRLRVTRIDVERHADVASRFEVEVVPTLVLVKDRRVAGRLEGRASAPKIQRLLEPHLASRPEPPARVAPAPAPA